MVPKGSGIKSALELKGATVCVLTGTTTELNLADYNRKNNLKIQAVTFEDNTSATTPTCRAVATRSPTTSRAWPRPRRSLPIR